MFNHLAVMLIKNNEIVSNIGLYEDLLLFFKLLQLNGKRREMKEIYVQRCIHLLGAIYIAR